MSQAENVERGVALLDKAMPGWAATIRGRMTDGLFDITNWEHCIVGSLELMQYTGNPGETERVIVLNGTTLAAFGQDARDHGFVADEDESLADDPWEELDELWADAVRERVSA